MAGYIPMPECFGRGGYEPRTLPHNRFAHDAAHVFIKQGGRVLEKLLQEQSSG